MNDLDQHIHEELERLTSLAPLPPSVEEITSGRPAVVRDRRPVLIGLAAAAVVLAFVAGAVVLRQPVTTAVGSPRRCRPTPSMSSCT